MKVSNYNFFYPFKKDYIAYNSLTNALAIMQSEDYEEYKRYNKSNISLTRKLEEDLKKGGFLVEEDFDELSIIRFRMNNSRYDTSALQLTIAPTSDCNFRCIYCYEKDSISAAKMSKQTQDNLIELIRLHISKIDKLDITWYGGEPLLAMDIINSLSKRIISLCKENNVQYAAGMITNGFLLNKRNLELINSNKINFLQITLDGTKDTHDARRFLKGNVGTFDTIVGNLIKYKDELPQVSLRINVDKNNSNKIMPLLKMLQDNGLNDKVIPYLGHVRDINECYNKGDCLVTREFSDLQLDLNIKMNKEKENFYPMSMFNACGADSKNSYVVDAIGRLYKCWDDIGYPERTVGTLANIEVTSTLLQYLLFDPTENMECRECKYLPICMGGCPHMFGKTESCNVNKYTLEKNLHHFVKLSLSQNEHQKVY
jgi:Arylsulfatase regulator (Fe-S oxidoreductase)